MSWRDLRGAALAGWLLTAEGAVAGTAALLFAGYGLERAATFTSSGDDYADGIGALLIVATFVIAALLALYAPVALLLGRAVRKGAHRAWIGALTLSAAQVLATALAWPLLIPLALMGAAEIAVLVLPQTRAECARPAPADDDQGYLETEPEPAELPV